MNLIKELNDELKDPDPVEMAIAESISPCSKYFDPDRTKDFAKTISEMMESGQSYEDAKAVVFDDVEIPPSNSPCCRLLKNQVIKLRGE